MEVQKKGHETFRSVALLFFCTGGQTKQKLRLAEATNVDFDLAQVVHAFF